MMGNLHIGGKQFGAQTTDSPGAGKSRGSKSRRLLERFRVPGAVAECRIPSRLFFWKRTGPLCRICDLCLSGASLRNPGLRLKPQTTVRLNMLLAPEMWARVKAKVIWVKESTEAKCQFCGLEFTDFRGKAWHTLCLMHDKHLNGSGVGDVRPLGEFDIRRVREEFPDTVAAC